MEMIHQIVMAAASADGVAEILGRPGVIAQIGTLFMLILLQAVLGFDNLLYISLESKRAPEKDQKFVRQMGIGLAVALRIVLLFVLVNLVAMFQKSMFTLDYGWIKGDFNFHAIIVLFGGAFILYTAMKEILHMMHIEYGHGMDTSPSSKAKVIFLIVMMNLIFSFDSILSAMALAQYRDTAGNVDHIMWVMVVAILVSGVLMIWLADTVSEFLQKNRMYEVVGLIILFIVGVLLLTEGAHLGHLTLFGSEITPMTKTSFYFVIFVVVILNVIQTRYRKKLMVESQAKMAKLEQNS